MIGTQHFAASLSFIRYNIAKQRKDISWQLRSTKL
jgi:hypothetical protein